MSNKKGLKVVKVYAKDQAEKVEVFSKAQGYPLTRRQRRSMRATVPLGSYRIDHLEPHQPYPNCGPKCKEVWK